MTFNNLKWLFTTALITLYACISIAQIERLSKGEVVDRLNEYIDLNFDDVDEEALALLVEGGHDHGQGCGSFCG